MVASTARLGRTPLLRLGQYNIAQEQVCLVEEIVHRFHDVSHVLKMNRLVRQLYHHAVLVLCVAEGRSILVSVVEVFDYLLDAFERFIAVQLGH